MVLIADTGPSGHARDSMLALQQTVPSVNQFHHLSYSNHRNIQLWLPWPTCMVTRSVFTLRIVCTLGALCKSQVSMSCYCNSEQGALIVATLSLCLSGHLLLPVQDADCSPFLQTKTALM